MALNVVVGTGEVNDEVELKEREELAKTIEANGFKVERAPVMWPRDSFVYDYGRYLTVKDNQSCGEGGFIYNAKDFVLVADIANFAELAAKDYGRPAYGIPLGREHYFISLGRLAGESDVLDLIDLSCLLIPTKRLLIVDETHYRNALKRTQLEELKRKIDLTLEFYSPERNEISHWPVNCLVVPVGEGKEVVFANERPKSFLKLLAKHLDVVKVNMSVTAERHRGSVRCSTNIKDDTEDLQDLLYFGPKIPKS